MTTRRAAKTILTGAIRVGRFQTQKSAFGAVRLSETSGVHSSWRTLTSTGDSDGGFLDHWRRQIQEGKLKPDQAQERVAKRLHRLQQALAGYSNGAFFVERIPAVVKEKDEASLEEPKSPEDTNVSGPPLPRIPRGLYIYGPVGTGKSLLMDTFYSAVETIDVVRKARYHFHAFMAHIHARIHYLNRNDLRTRGRNFAVDTSQDHNPIVRVARQLARQTTLLCLDEFQVTDVADAMILRQLFEELWAHGTVVVATSNRPPRDLYEGGLNWGYFAPFIESMERHCIVHSLESALGDYRKVLSKEPPPTTAPTRIAFPETGGFFFSTKNSQIHRVMEVLSWQVDSSPGDHDTANSLIGLESFDLSVGFGRSVTVATGDPKGLIGFFSFEELCDGDLGASDYRAIGRHFTIVVLRDVPRLSTHHHNRARRFITLVDELYEAKCALVCSTVDAMETADELFQPPQESADQVEGISLDLEETFWLEDVQTQGGQPVGTLASVRELSFAFRRAASRITEMTSERWWNQILTQPAGSG